MDDRAILARIGCELLEIGVLAFGFAFHDYPGVSTILPSFPAASRTSHLAVGIELHCALTKVPDVAIVIDRVPIVSVLSFNPAFEILLVYYARRDSLDHLGLARNCKHAPSRDIIN